ncbi:choice-of-anchor L domain-containing protein, partial [Aquimarina hainanensis]
MDIITPNLIKHTHKNYLLFSFLLLLFPFVSFSQATLTTGPTDAQIFAELEGEGVTLSNPLLVSGIRASQIGLFSNGLGGANLSLDSGIAFTTGTVTEAFTTNNQIQVTEGPAGGATFSYPPITAIDPTANNDVVVYEFDVTLDPNIRELVVEYQFGSDEYPDYVGSRFNDIFGFFVSGPGITGTQNIALVPGTSSPVAVNTINAGFVGCFDDPTTEDLTNSAIYINNGHTTTGACNTNPGPFVITTEYNGLTGRITGNLSGLTPGNTYRFAIAIADTGDPSLDSGVFVSQISGLGDSDLDGLSDAVDLDDDNDGILDSTECQSSSSNFTVASSTNGTFVLSNSGGTANWTISNSGGSLVSSGLSDNNELYYVHTGSNPWDLSTTFQISSLPVGADIELILYGFVDKTSPDFNASFGSRFGTYTISWLGGIGDARVYDPAGNQIVGGEQSISNGGNFVQNGVFNNNVLQWYVVFPVGATQFTINAEGGAGLEGFRFAANEIFCPDTDGDSIPDYLDNDSDNDSCADALEGDNGGLTLASLDANGRITGGVDANGVPTAVSGGQADVSSTNNAVTSTTCDDDGDGVINGNDVCTGFSDTADADGDGVPDGCDLDSDNDGVSDIDEGICTLTSTGTWTGSGTTFSSNAAGVTVTTTSTFTAPANSLPFSDNTFNTTNFWTPNLASAPSLIYDVNWDSTPDSGADIDLPSDDQGSGTLTFTFSEPVTDPTFHIDKLGGNGSSGSLSLSNSLQLTMVTSGVTLSRLSGSDDFQVLGGTTIQRAPNVVMTSNSPETLAGMTEGTASGSVRINGTFTSVTFNWKGVGIEGFGGDLIEFALQTCVSRDSDNDGKPDYLDLDSDNDGIADIIEAGGIDTDGDGAIDYPTPGDPTSMTDADGDGLEDSVDTIDSGSGAGEVTSGTALLNPDSDNDGIVDSLDLDSDNDGLTDISEAGGVDTDGDGEIDYPTPGDPTSMADVDGDGFADSVDTDDNTVAGTGDGGTMLPLPNTDGTGGLDYQDIDSDGDGIVDNIEGQPTVGYVAPSGTDTDGDGIDDS